jgi:hypothetical protein
MADANPRGPGATEPITSNDTDTEDKATVLRETLFIYPETRTLEELVRELTIAATGSVERDRVERAHRDLIAAGLLHRPGAEEIVRPTWAAVNYFRLAGEV